MLYTDTTILTLDDERRIITDGALLVTGDRIAAVGKATELRAAHPEEPTTSLGGGITLPGLIDTHVHTAQCMLRGVSEAAPAPDFRSWLFGRIFALQGAYTVADAAASASLCVLDMVRSGTTGFVECLLADHYGLDSIARICADAGIRAALGALVMDVDPATRDAMGWPVEMWQTRRSGIDNALAGRARWNDGDSGVQVWFGCRSIEQAQDLSVFREVGELARANDMGITIHLAELPVDNEFARSLGHRSAIELASDLGLLGPRTVLAHCTVADDADVALLAATGTTVSHCPANNSAAGWGPAPVREMLDAGVNVTLGCDGAPSNTNMDLLRDLRIAAHVARVRASSRLALSPETILEMATRNGAHALGMGDRLGSLEPGKLADFIVIDTDAAHLQPIWSPAATVVFGAQGSDVDTVVIGGREIVRRREVLTMDAETIVADVRARRPVVAERAGVTGIVPLWPVT